MGVIDFSTALNNSISAGSAVEGNVVRIIADNGTEIGEGVFKVIEGGNGTAAEVGVATQTGTSGAVATGMAYLSTPVSTVVAALAPAFGIVAGIGLYNLAPSFWTTLSESLINAGKTIGGKIIGYWNGENVYFDEETIEIIKNALLNVGAFDFTDPTLPSYQSEGSVTITKRLSPIEILTFVNNNSRAINYSAIQNDITNFIAQYWSADKICKLSLYRKQEAFQGEGAFSLSISYASYPDDSLVTLGGAYFYTLSGSSSSAEAGEPINIVSSRVLTGYGNLFTGTEYTGNNVNHSGINGEPGESNFPLQDNATYPDDEEFPLTYPNWVPHEFPSTLPDPSELPDIYPVKYPGVGPDGYPDQDPAQNPDPESVPEIYPQIMPDFPIPDPGLPAPEPEPEPDPDPQPEPDPIPESESEPGEDPVDPNIPPDPSLPIIVPPLPSTASSNKLFTVYNPSSSQLDSLGGYLWDASLIATLRDIWQDPLDGIISLQQVFVTPTTSGNQNIMLGYLNTGISSPVVSSQFVTVDCGSVSVPENKKNATDYAPYTSLHLYLPFIGILELDVNECMNGTISVKYQVDVYTGTCLAQVSIDRDADMPNDPILYTFSGNCSQQLPLTSGNATGLLTALIGAVGAGIKASSGGALSALAGAQLLGNSISHEMMHVSHSGNISANAGIMGQKKPYLIIGRRHCYDANNYNAYYGFPANKTLVIGNYNGFIRAKKCWIKTTALQEEYEEIMRLLEDGVFV